MKNAIDAKPSYEQRLNEASDHIQNGHYRSAVESASGGIELLMQSLFAELREELLQEGDTKKSLYLKGRHDERAQEKHPRGELMFGEWIKFYDDEDIMDELYAVYRYDFNYFCLDALHKIIKVRNRCVHKNYQPSIQETELVRNYLAMFLKETAREPKSEETKTDTIASWRDAWRLEWDERIHDWTEQFSNTPQAELLSALTDMLMLVTGLVGDNRIAYPQKSPLILAVQYVIHPVDLIPEEIVGVPGLLDDVAVLTFTLHRFMGAVEMDNVILRDHWDREEDPREFIDNTQKYIHEYHDELYEDDIWEKLQQVADKGIMGVLWNNAPAQESNGENRIRNIYQFITEEESDTNDDWYKRWRQKIDLWAKDNGSSDIASIILAVPDMFVLVTRLIRDARVNPMIKARLLAASAYVVSPFDLIPEGLVGVIGLTDDAGALALIGYWLINIVSIDKELLREHWPGETDESDPVEMIQDLHHKFTENAEALFGDSTGIWKNLQERFGKKHDANRGGIRAVIRRIFGKSET